MVRRMTMGLFGFGMGTVMYFPFPSFVSSVMLPLVATTLFGCAGAGGAGSNNCFLGGGGGGDDDWGGELVCFFLIMVVVIVVVV